MKLDVPSSRGDSSRGDDKGRKSSRDDTHRRERKEEERSKKSSRNDKERDKERNDETPQKRSSRNDKDKDKNDDKKDDTTGRRSHKDDTPRHISDGGKTSSHRDTPRYSSSNGTKRRSDRSEKEESKSRVTTPRAPPEPKIIPFFSTDDISQMAQLSHEQQDDEVRTLCKQALGFFCRPQAEVDEKAEIEFRKMLLKYELRINSYEMEYNETRKEIERLRQEKELVEAKRILMKDKLAPLLDQLDAARKKRKERMETENLALVVNEKKSQKGLSVDIQNSEEAMKASVEAQKEIERRKAIRYEALLGMGETLRKFEEQLKEDFSLGKPEDDNTSL